ncbi:MAG: flavodoxin domain-containing protein [Gemmatimonadales bacterium]|jgi:menaquinone-dependent protoporphyrinogen oxidase
MRILLVYGTRYGQTAKIAERIRETLSEHYHDVVVANASAAGSTLDAAAFDGVIVGASVIGGLHQSAVQSFVTRNRAILNATPSAFFSVSGSAGSADRGVRAEATVLLNKFLTATGWSPRVAAAIAGTINYTQYSPAIRWISKRVYRRIGCPIDTSRDWELTDWAQVTQFARDVERAVVGAQRRLGARATVGTLTAGYAGALRRA